MMSEQEILTICEKYRITNYTINPDGSIDVNGSVYLYNMDLTEIPLKFNKVSGYFDCSNNQLKSLKGSPKKVGGDCNVSYNNLTSLEGCPKEVGDTFYCSSNKLTSLEGSPKDVKDKFYCDNNPLESLDGFNGNYDMLVCTNKDKLIRKTKLKILNIL